MEAIIVSIITGVLSLFGAFYSGETQFIGTDKLLDFEKFYYNTKVEVNNYVNNKGWLWRNGEGKSKSQSITQTETRNDWSSPHTLSATLEVGKTYTLVFGIYGTNNVISNGGLDFTNCTGMNILNVSYGYIGVWSYYYTAAVVTFTATSVSATLNISPKSGTTVANYSGETLVQLD